MKKTSSLKIINSLISIGLMLGVGQLSPIGEITPLGMQIIGIFAGVIWGWCTIDLIWPSILALLVLGGLTEYMTITQAISSIFTNQSVLITLFFFVIAAMVNECGLGDVIAAKLLKIKITAGKPWLFSLLLCYIAVIAIPFIKFAPTVILCWGILYNICDAAGYKKGDKWPALMVFGIIYSVSFSAALVPTYAGNQANIGMLASIYPDVVFSYGKFEIFAFLISFITPVIYILTCKFILRADVSKLKYIDFTAFSEDMITLSKKQKVIIGYFLVFILVLLAESVLPNGLFLKFILSKLGTLGIVLLFLVLALIIQVDGEPLMNFQKMASQGIMWSLILMLGTALTLASALTSPDTNVKVVIANLLTPIFGNYSPLLFCIVVSIVALILTNFISNSVVSAILLPIVLPFADQIGFNPAAMTAIMIMSTAFATMLPSASPVGALLHGNKEWISFKQAVLLSIMCMITYTILMAVLFIPLSRVLF